jgi:hypothetical protein
MDGSDTAPGPLREEKTDQESPAGSAQPQTAEVESARLLMNDARSRLRALGLDDEVIRRLADRFVAEDRGQDADVFVDWALAHRDVA